MEARRAILIRMYIVLVGLSVLAAAVIGDVVWVFATQGDDLRERGKKQASLIQEVPAMRGAILDAGGRVLAVNVPRYELALDPTVEGFTDEVRSSFFDRFARLTGVRVSDLRRKVNSRKSPRYVLLERDLSESQKEIVESWEVPGLVLTPRFARRYNYDRTGAHILGHVDADGRGIAGLELQDEGFLSGIPGRRVVKRDRLGRIKAFVGGQVVEPRHGETLVLTIDLIRQTLLEEELLRGVNEMNANWGAVIAMDPNTGAILAMASAPTYDPNNPGAYQTAAFRNHAVTDRLEPGSTFKLITAAAAIDQGKVHMDEIIHTGDGRAAFGGRTITDSHPLGSVTFSDAIAHSSNVALAAVGSRLKPGVLYRYARDLGFGQPTWIDLPGEVGGLLKKPETWSRTSQSRISIGYEVDVTPLQILTAYSALANGGWVVRPYVVAERRDVTGRTVWAMKPDSVRRAFSQATAVQLRPAFEKVVSEGTAERALIDGLPVAGKTGTARKATASGYQAGKYRTTFVGYFPADQPRVAMIVVLDEPRNAVYGGTAAAPIFQRIARRWAATFPAIAERMAPAGTLPHVVPETPDRDVRKVMVHRKASRMPAVTGLSAREATVLLASLGVPAGVDGGGLVTSQSPAAGAPLPAKAQLRCR